MPDFDVTPDAFWWNPNLDAHTLRQDLHNNNGRLVSLDAFGTGDALRFCAAWVANEGAAKAAGSDWDPDIDAHTLRKKMTDESSRITCLTSYVTSAGRRYAAAWIKNTGDHHKKWWWTEDMGTDELGSKVAKDNGRLAAIDAWDVSGTTRCAAVWISNTGADAAANWWHPRVDADGLAQFLQNNTGRITCLDAYNVGDDVLYAAGWIGNEPPLDRTWFWWHGLTSEQLGQKFDLFCSYPVEIRSYLHSDGSRALAAATIAPPPPPDPGDALLSATLSGTLTKAASDNPSSPTDTEYDPAPLHQWMDVDVKLANTGTGNVTVELAELYPAESGGFIYADGPEDALAGIFGGAGPTLAAGGSLHGTGTRESGFGIEQYVLRWRAKQAGAKQDAFASGRVKRSGYSAPPKLDAPDPVMLTLWTDPAEFVPVWEAGRATTWLTVGGQILNATDDKLRIAGFSVTLTVDGHTLLDEPFAPAFNRFNPNRLDPHKTFDAVPPFGDVPELSGFATYFVTGFDLPKVPAHFDHAHLTLVLNYKIGSRCGAAVYETPVVHVAATIVSPPLKGTWNFGSSPDHQGFDAHAWPGQRFSVDFTKLGADGQSIKPDAPDNDNKSFWAYGHDIFAMAPGKVEAAVDANPPNHGRHMLANPLINYILVHHRDSDGPGGDFYHGYYHVFQDGNQVQAGDHVAAGDHIARVGNAGGSSEPHLHIGAIRLDQTGNGTTIPLAYSGLVQDDTKVTVVPGTGQYTS